MARKGGRKWIFRFLVVGIPLLLIYGWMVLFRAGDPAVITIEPQLPAIGKATPVKIVVEQISRGFGDVTIELVQGEKTTELATLESSPRAPHKLWGEVNGLAEWTLSVGRDEVSTLREGEATIRVTAGTAGALLRTPRPAEASVTLPVYLVPPPLGRTSSRTYVNQGGCEAVVYTVGDRSVKDGVQAGEYFFPGYPLPGGGARDRFALFAVPYDMDDAGGVRLIAEDLVGNRSEARIIDQFTRKPPKRDTIRITDGFMEKVVPAILANTPEMEDQGDLLKNYLAINGDLRAQNTATLNGLVGASKQEFLWNRRFISLPNAAARSAFADRRTYTYEGRDVDHQDHLGYDLASVRNAPIPAANDGVVLMARYLGIYGNVVVIDHGYGLMSLYGHLASIGVSEGQEVGRGDAIGTTGETGLAGGDHLHFTMMLQGLPVDPKEWWDAHWIQDRLATKLGPALNFQN
jgi:murein DD-endopeptidase MepM/ murein hydrolase activator NlpD